MNEWVNEWINDYVYMRTNNAIISNNQSKDLIALWCLHVKSKALTPVYMQFTLFLLLWLFFTAIIHIPHCTAQMMDSERAEWVLLGALLIYLRLMHNDFVWRYSTLFRHHRNVMEYAAYAFYWPFVDEGIRNRDWWQLTLLEFSPECDAFFPAIISNLRIITGAWHVIHVWHKRMRTLVRAAILRLRCLHACIFRLKSAYATYVNTIILAAIMILIALFRSKYCVYMR